MNKSQTASKVDVSKTATRTCRVIFYTVSQNVNMLLPSLYQCLRTAVWNCVSCCHSHNGILCSTAVWNCVSCCHSHNSILCSTAVWNCVSCCHSHNGILRSTAVWNCVSCCHSHNGILCSTCVLVFFHWAKEVKISQGNVQVVGRAVSKFTSEFLNCVMGCMSCIVLTLMFFFNYTFILYIF